MQESFSDELSKLQVSLRQGLAVKEYQHQDTVRCALMVSLGILKAFGMDFDKFCAIDSVNHSLEIIHTRYENKWKALPSHHCQHKLMIGAGFLAVDIELFKEAEELFHLLAQLEPDNVHPLLGLAYTKLNEGSAHEALAVIRDKVLSIAPGNDLGIAFLSLAYDALDMPEDALAAASAVIAADRDESAVRLAREVQNDIGRCPV
jgi:tetratricopeptide (TPR) repeat protein